MENYQRPVNEAFVRKSSCEQLVIVGLDRWLEHRRHSPEAYEIAVEILDTIQELQDETGNDNPVAKQEILDYAWYAHCSDRKPTV